MTSRSSTTTARTSSEARAVARTQTLLQGKNGIGTVRRTTLPGGLRIVTETLPSVRSATFGIWAHVGSRDETPALNGATHYLEHLLFKGTHKRSALDISSAIDAVGGEMNAFTAKEYTCYYARVLDTDLPLAIDVVCDMLTGSLILEEDVDAERGVILEEIAMTEDDPGDCVHDLFAHTMFGDTPLGRPVLGTVDTVNALGADRIRRFYKKHYDPTHLVVAAAGNIDHDKVVRQVRAAFEKAGALTRTDAEPRSPRATAAARLRTAGRVDLLEPQDRAGPRRPRHAGPRPHRRAPLGARRAEHRPRRRHVLPPLPGGPGEARPRLQRVLVHLGLRRLRPLRRVRGLPPEPGPRRAEDLPRRTRQGRLRRARRTTRSSRAIGQLSGSTVLGLEDTGALMNRIGKSELCWGDADVGRRHAGPDRRRHPGRRPRGRPRGTGTAPLAVGDRPAEGQAGRPPRTKRSPRPYGKEAEQ